VKSLRETYGISGSLGIYGGSLRGRHHTNLGGPGTATQGDGSTDGSASEPDGPMGSGGTGGMSNTSGGTVLAMSDNDELEQDKVRKSKKMQHETTKRTTTVRLSKENLKRLVKEEIKRTLAEAIDDPPKEDWAKFGKKVDDFINDMIEKCDKLFEEGEEQLYDKEDDKDGGDDKFRYISARLAFLKNARNKLAQRYEGLRRED